MGEPTWRVKAFAQAIAHAEGFGVSDTIPTRAHNPGDLVMPNWRGESLGAEKISIFDDDKTGWTALYRQLGLIVSRQSHVYNPNMTIREMSKKWTATQQEEWASNVSNWLTLKGINATPDTRLYEVIP